jgi:hypothetical protein
VEKRLICPRCGDVVADVVYRRWPGRLTVRSLKGYEIMPVRAGAIRRDVDVGDDHPADLVYELTCHNGHTTTRAMPRIVAALRRSGGQWVEL